MPSVYEAYKPLRNHLRHCHLEASLQDLWAISVHVLTGTALPVPPGVRPYSLREFLLPWDLPLLAREVVLNATMQGSKRLNSFDSMAKIVNAIRHVEETGARARGTGAAVLAELHRISHRQFPWQKRRDLVSLLRYLKVFGEKEVEAVLQHETGLGIKEFYFLGLAVSGHLIRRFDINADQDYSSFGITRELSTRFFRSLSLPVADLRREIVAQQVFDAGWEYAWNPLDAHPLVSLDPANPNRMYCPVPDLLLRAISQGLYYKLVAATGFGDAFGHSFQAYVGDVIRAVFTGEQFQVFAEQEYWVGKARHDGTDWIISGTDANLFIECKTKRMRRLAKFAVGDDELVKDIDLMAAAIVQLYKNIIEAEQGLSTWVPNGKPSYPLLVTLEDWFLFGPVPQQLLAESVVKKLIAANLEQSILTTMPYTIASSREFERMAGVIRDVGIRAFFTCKGQAKYHGWMLEEIARDCFPDAERTNLQALFRDDWKRVVPDGVVPLRSSN